MFYTKWVSQPNYLDRPLDYLALLLKSFDKRLGFRRLGVLEAFWHLKTSNQEYAEVELLFVSIHVDGRCKDFMGCLSSYYYTSSSGYDEMTKNHLLGSEMTF
ncbi:hypothetical protein ACH5RR_016622 [Cinchona calisaya]|uniref:Uncharacterized protein n=1 Tax=Cinchona calisaya TaxID=153742 RepID=A0ABD3A223_9GENT